MRLLEPGWERGIPSCGEIDKFVEPRRIESFHPLPSRKRPNNNYRRVLAAYRRQCGVIHAILTKGASPWTPTRA